MYNWSDAVKKSQTLTLKSARPLSPESVSSLGRAEREQSVITSAHAQSDEKDKTLPSKAQNVVKDKTRSSSVHHERKASGEFFLGQTYNEKRASSSSQHYREKSLSSLTSNYSENNLVSFGRRQPQGRQRYPPDLVHQDFSSSPSPSSCSCQVSYVLKTCIFLAALLGASCGLLIWFFSQQGLSGVGELLQHGPENVAGNLTSLSRTKVFLQGFLDEDKKAILDGSVFKEVSFNATDSDDESEVINIEIVHSTDRTVFKDDSVEDNLKELPRSIDTSILNSNINNPNRNSSNNQNTTSFLPEESTRKQFENRSELLVKDTHTKIVLEDKEGLSNDVKEDKDGVSTDVKTAIGNWKNESFQVIYPSSAQESSIPTFLESTFQFVDPEIETFTVSSTATSSPPSPTTENYHAIHQTLTYSKKEPITSLAKLISFTNDDAFTPLTGLVPFTTKTVYGFLDFITTVSNTVIIFTPGQGIEKTPSIAASASIASSTSPSVTIDPTMTLGLESLFQNLEKERSLEPIIQSSHEERTLTTEIRPTSVRTNSITRNNRGRVKHQPDNKVFAKISSKSFISKQRAKLEPEITSPIFTVNRNIKTIREDFFGGAGVGAFPTGVVTTTADTLIANGLTTIRSTKVFGTFLDGEYAQVVQSTAKVFQAGEEKEGGFAGSAQITELPQFDLEAKSVGIDSSVVSGIGSVKLIGQPKEPIKDRLKSRIRINNNRRTSAISSFRERLKNRYQKFRETAPESENDISAKPRNINLSGVTSDVVVINGDGQGKTTVILKGTKSSNRLRERGRSRSLKPKEANGADTSEETGRIKTTQKSVRLTSGRQRSRLSRTRPSFKRNKDFRRNKISGEEKSNRIRPNNISSQPKTVELTSVVHINPTTSSKFRQHRFSSTSSSNNAPKIHIKKFNRFSRPRKDFLNRFIKRRPVNKNITTPTETKDNKSEETIMTDVDKTYLPIVPSFSKDEKSLKSADEDLKLKSLQTTLLVSTVYPKEATDEYLEIATIRSPYTFAVEDNSKSTRFITITRTKSKTIATTEAPSSAFIKPTSTFAARLGVALPHTNVISNFEDLSSQKYSEIIPETKNIESLIQGTKNIETLPPVTITQRALGEGPLFKTIADTFSTEEVIVKRSILPVIQGSKTSYYTLSQYYTVTRFLTALKTLPPAGFSDFNPTKILTDFDQFFDEAGSEKKYETVLPGEFEHNEQDDFEMMDPIITEDFKNDFESFGAKIDFLDNIEKDSNTEVIQLKNQPSFSKPIPHIANFTEIKPTRTQALFLPNNSLQPNGFLGTLGLNPEQLQYLQMLQKPLELGGSQIDKKVPKANTERKPTYRTETVYETDTIKLFHGPSSFFSTLTRSVGMTTITESPLSFGSFEEQPPVTVVTETVTKDTVVPSLIEESYRIRFRNELVFTTITSTTLIPTQITEIVTQTKLASSF